MISTEKTLLAKEMAEKAHEGELDKVGQAYILHPLYLAEHCDDEKSTVVALLHDVFEDSNLYSLEKLRELGFEEDIIEALKLLTHDRQVSYMDYIASIKSNELARKVKLLDLKHNLDLSRVPEDMLDKFLLAMEAKRALYKEAVILLEE